MLKILTHNTLWKIGKIGNPFDALVRIFIYKSISSPMTKISPLKVMASAVFIFFAGFSMAQDCSDPQKVCAETSEETISTQNGVNNILPNDFCFDQAENAVFFSFETLDLVQFPGLSFDDPTATLSFMGLNCNSDTLFGQGILAAIFTADDLCQSSTYGTPIACDTLYQDAEVMLANLQASTTYYVLISGFTGDLPAVNPGECEVTISVSGPGVTYDLEANWQVEGSGNQPTLLTGQTVVLEANSDISGYTWSGEALNSFSGTPVTATPLGTDKNLSYSVEVTINDCVFQETLNVPLRPAIVPYNAFTPNNDGVNDNWKIDGITQWPNAQIYVYSRWGTKVFQTINYNNDWDGDDLPAATYYYVIELNPLDFNIEPYTGSVTIIR